MNVRVKVPISNSKARHVTSTTLESCLNNRKKREKGKWQWGKKGRENRTFIHSDSLSNKYN
jgi:hypothetical protein